MRQLSSRTDPQYFFALSGRGHRTRQRLPRWSQRLSPIVACCCGDDIAVVEPAVEGEPMCRRFGCLISDGLDRHSSIGGQSYGHAPALINEDVSGRHMMRVNRKDIQP
jgi:hypothetical protein